MARIAIARAVRPAALIVVTLARMPAGPVAAQESSPTGAPAAQAAPAAAAAPAPLAELSCELVGGRVYIPITIGDHALQAVLDTGAGASVMDLALAQEWKLPSSGPVTGRGTGREAVSGLLLDDVSARFAGLSEPILAAIPLSPLAEWEGRPLQVILGESFFAAHVVEFDYAARRVRVFDRTADFAAGLPGDAVLPLRFVEGQPVTAARLTVGGTSYAADAHIDSGASRSGLTGTFLAEHPLDVKTTPRFSMSVGVGGRADGRLFRPDAVALGGLSFVQPVLTMSEPDSGLSGSAARYGLVVGADILRRCRVIVDYPHERMLLSPGADLHAPFEVDRTGMSLKAQADDLRCYSVMAVLEGSTAAAAGIEAGDVLVTVDGRPAAEYSLQELRDLFKSPAAAGWRLALRRGEQTLEIGLAARAII